MESLVNIEEGLHSSSHFVRRQTTDLVKNIKNHLTEATSNPNLRGMSEEQLTQNLADVESAMQRNYKNAGHQQLLRGMLKDIQSEVNNRKTIKK